MRTPVITALALAFGSLLAAQTPSHYGYQVIRSFPHDASSFTQGLEFHGGFLYEGSGLNGKSSLRKVRLKTGEILQRVDLAPEYFGEGITVYKDLILQLTWQSQTGFIYRATDFQLLRRFSYAGEGWGLANNGREIYLSDGTSEIRVLDGATLAEVRRIKVRDGDTAIDQLNELEYVNGEIFANVWQTDRIARISPATGKVTGWINLQGLPGPEHPEWTGAVLNGIAYDAAGKRLFVTGKLWPRIYQIRLIRK